jgi:hypothetical protein
VKSDFAVPPGQSRGMMFFPIIQHVENRSFVRCFEYVPAAFARPRCTQIAHLKKNIALTRKQWLSL